jgi:hypothetical protein
MAGRRRFGKALRGRTRHGPESGKQVPKIFFCRNLANSFFA